MIDKERRKVFKTVMEMELNEARNFVFSEKKRYRNFRDAFDRYKRGSYKKFTFKNVKDLEYKLIRIL